MFLPGGLVLSVSSDDVWVGFAPLHGSFFVRVAIQSSWVTRNFFASSEVSVAEITSLKTFFFAIFNRWSIVEGISFFSRAIKNCKIASVVWTEFLSDQSTKKSVDFNSVLPDLILCFILKNWNSFMCIIQFLTLFSCHLNLKFMELMSLLSENFIGKVVHCVSLNWLIETGKSDSPVDQTSVFGDTG